MTGQRHLLLYGLKLTPIITLREKDKETGAQKVIRSLAKVLKWVCLNSGLPITNCVNLGKVLSLSDPPNLTYSVVEIQ